MTKKTTIGRARAKSYMQVETKITFLFFMLRGGWKNCLHLVGSLIEEYLKNGKYSSLLKNSQAVAFGFVDGALNIAVQIA
ncbi:MAG: hypothetical protein OSJ74_08555 [Clostridia bacterium]|nr:hypothetical protein [Clostridia bacterium]